MIVAGLTTNSSGKERQDVPKKNRIEAAIEDAALAFAQEIIETIRSATVDELSELTTNMPATPKRRGRPPKAVVPAPSAVAAEPTKKPRKKRAWPKCSVDGCETNIYMPSGAKKMCYQHHLEAGGEPTPLLGAKKKGKKPAKPVKATKAEKPAAKPSKAPVVKPTPAKTEKVEPKAKKKRKWPQCSVEGCEKNLYAPSPKKMCYAHHMEAGGAPSPLVAARMKKAEAKAKAKAEKAEAKKEE